MINFTGKCILRRKLVGKEKRKKEKEQEEVWWGQEAKDSFRQM